MAARDPALAAALFAALGAEIPCDAARKAEADALLRTMTGRTAALERILALCAPPESPQELYLSAKACAWLGGGHRAEGIDLAARYLQGPPWDALPTGQVEQDGIPVDWRSAVRADLLRDMAQSELILGRLSDAYSHSMAACAIEPYNAMNFIKASEVVARLSGREEALRFLRGQRKNVWHAPVSYRDAAGCPRVNSLFRDLLDAQIRKLEQAGHTQKNG